MTGFGLVTPVQAIPPHHNFEPSRGTAAGWLVQRLPGTTPVFLGFSRRVMSLTPMTQWAQVQVLRGQIDQPKIDP